MPNLDYNPFARGPFPVGVHSLAAHDAARGRTFMVEIWYPAALAHAPSYPLIVFSHYGGGHPPPATFLTTPLASHGFVVAAMDHSEVSVPELARPKNEDDEGRAARIQA